jgi:hypothetical protein
MDFRALRNRYQDLRQPVLLMWGELDPVIPYALADSIARKIRCGQLVSFPRALHRPQAEIQERSLELPSSHRVPLSWLLEHGNESIKLRTYQEFAAPGTVAPEVLESLTQAIAANKTTQAIVKKQKDSGVWGGNLLALAPSAKDGSSVRIPKADQGRRGAWRGRVGARAHA